MVKSGFGIAVVLALSLVVCSANAEETKRYNFNTRQKPIVTDEAEPEKIADDAKPDDASTSAEETPKVTTEAPVATPEEPTTKVVNGVYSPDKNSPAGTGRNRGSFPAIPKLSKTMKAEKAEQLVRFFIGSCFKFYGRNDDMIKYLDEHFPRLDTDRKADFAPVIAGNINTQYWDIVRGNSYYMLAKDTSSGKCDVIAKDGASTAIHRELKAVMDGLSITKILETKTQYEKVRKQNKEVSIVNILGHPLEKELGIVATTEIKDTGSNMATTLTLFTVPQESVEIKEVE